MKKPCTYTFLFVVASLIIFSCAKKTSYIAPATPPQAALSQSLVAAAAQNPNLKFYSGTGAPSTIGDTGDYYLELHYGDFYGPKTINGWGASWPLKSDTSNSHIFSGPSIPGDALGQPGDFYLDVWLFQLYGPKSDSTGWGTPINL